MSKNLLADIEAAARDSELARMQLKLDKAEKQAKSDAEYRKSAEALLEKQLETIEGLRKPRVTYTPGKPRKSKAGDFCRLLIPDTHGSHIEPAAMSALLSDMELLRPQEVVLLGDHLDCGGFLAEHHTMGFVAETEYAFCDDVGAANEFLDKVQSYSAPKARIDYLEGNHEHRIEKWCVTEALRHPRDAKFLRDLLAPPAVLSLEKRKIRYASLYDHHDGLSVQGAIKRGRCHFVHGISHAKHAADVTLAKFGGCVAFGHTHRVDSWVTTIVGAGTIGAWSFGCLCKLQPYWQHGKPTGWSHGYGWQLVSAEGEFITLHVPIVNGKSLLQPLLGAVA